MSPRALTGLAAIAITAAAVAAACGESTRDAPPPSVSASSAAMVEPAEAKPSACARTAPQRLTPLHADVASAAVAVARLDDAAEVAILADEDQRAIHVFDATTLDELGVTSTKGKPRHVRVLADGRVAVTERDPERVALYELRAAAAEGSDAPMAELCAAELASDPYAIAEAPGALLVSSGFGAALTRLAAGDLAVQNVVPLAPEPRGVVVDPSGGRAYVSHAILGRVSVVDLADDSAAVKEISLGAGRLDTTTPLGAPTRVAPKPRASSQGYAIVPVPETDGHPFHLLVPGTTVDPGTKALGVTATYGGGRSGTIPVAPIISTIDVRAARTLTIDPQATTEGRDGNCLLPRSAALLGDALYVACLDLGEVVAFDASLVDPSTLVLRRFRVPVGPSAIATTSRGELLVWSEIDRRLSLVDTAAKKSPTLDEARRTDDVKVSVTPWEREGFEIDPVLARGRFLFHTSRDERISFLRACANCHPDGRADGLSWTSPDGLRQTPMLAGRLAGTAPFGWNGDHETIEIHVKDTAHRLGGSGFFTNDVPADKSDLAALVAYVRSLPAPAPRKTRSNRELVARGGRVFDGVCGSCHIEGATDTRTHDVHSKTPEEDKDRPFSKVGRIDTPSLVRIVGTAPYFHDGRFGSLADVVAATDGGMFSPERLGPEDRTALVAYLETL